MLNAPAVSGIRNLSTALNRSVGLLITTAVQTAFRKCEYWPLVPLGAIGIIEIHAYGVEFDDFVLCPEMPTSACSEQSQLLSRARRDEGRSRNPHAHGSPA